MTTIQLRRGNASQWATVNPVLAQGEPAIELDTGRRKLGNGVTAWNALGYEGTQPYVELVRDTAGRVALSVVQGVTNPVNNLSIASSPANNAPTLGVVGSDLNVGIILRPRGNGNIQIYADTGQVPTLQAIGADGSYELRLQSKGNQLVRLLDGNSATMFTASTVGATAVSYLDVANGSAAGGGITTFVRSTQATAGMFMRTKGTGTFLFGNENNETSLRIGTVAGAVNYVSVNGQVTTGTPLIETLGADTDITLQIRGKNAGRVLVTNLSATNAELTTPRINNIRDTNGALTINLVPVASAVNYWQFHNSPTDSGLTLLAGGTDANINMILRPKAAGNLQIYSEAGQNTAIQAIGADSNHHLVLMPKGTGVISLNDSSGMPILRAFGTTNPVNCFEVVNGATGAEVTFRAGGNDADIPIAIRPKGAASLIIRGFGNTRIAEFSSRAANMANRIVFQGGEAGSGPSIYPAGEANINLRIFASGTGVIDAVSMISHRTYTTASRPAANTVPAGTEFFNTTTKKPNYSDGTNWYDAAGVAA